MQKRDKRGLSAIITTLIMILLVLVAIGIVWVVVRNVITTGIEDVEVGKIMVDLKISDVKFYDNNISVKVKRNVGEGDIIGLKFVVYDGIESSIFEQENVVLNELEEKTYVLNYGELVKSVSVSPVLKTSSGKEKIGSIADEKEFTSAEVVENIPGLVSWWRFEGNVNDEVGGNDGSLEGGVNCNAQGKYGKACEFDGEGDYINISNSNSLNFVSGGFTLLAWVNFIIDITDKPIVGKHIGGYPNSYFLGVYFNNFTFFLESDWRLATKKAYNNGEWHNVVGVYNGTYQYLYVDGILEDSKLKSYSTTNNGNILIGGLTIDTGDFNSFNGTIDEVMIFNRALSENKIKAIYELELS